MTAAIWCNTLHAERPELLAGVLGGCESTTTGVARLRRMAAAGTLGFPMVAANAAETRRMLDNLYTGTGQSAIDGIIRATNTLLAGKVVVVAGFGSAGTGIAERARGLGAQVIVTEVDPVRALDAVMQGYRVLPMAAAPGRRGIHHGHRLPRRDRRRAPGSHARRRDPGQRLPLRRRDRRARAGGPGGDRQPQVRPHADEYVLADGRRLILLAEGRIVNLVAAEGHPAAVMDLSFAAQALVLAWLARDHDGLPPGVHDVPAAIDAQIASLMLASLGTRIDALTEAQRDYLDSLAVWLLNRVSMIIVIQPPIRIIQKLTSR